MGKLLQQRLKQDSDFHFGLTTGAAVSYIEQKVSEEGLIDFMTTKTRILLSDNRRAGRNANADRYGFIPFARYGNSVRYSRELILLWIDDELLPFLKRRKAQMATVKRLPKKKLTPILNRKDLHELTTAHYS